MRSPEDNGVGSIDLWERAFFQSEFTHASGVGQLTIYPGGFLGLWQSVVGSRGAFPVKYLVSAGETLEEFAMRCS
jgi:hypothetical protein